MYNEIFSFMPLMTQMPQLVPFYYLSEVYVTFFVMILLTYFFSKYFLPKTVRLFSTRVFISKL